MRAASALLVSLALITVGCARQPRFFDEYPGKNQPIDLRPGDYQGVAAYEPLAISRPFEAGSSLGPDQPWQEEAMQVNPVNPGVTPVAPSRLAALLPPAPAGWSSEEGNGQTVETPQGQLTEAGRNYWKGAAFVTSPTPDGRDLFPSVGITIVDRGQTGPEVADPADERTGVSLRPVQVEGFSGDEFDAGPGMKQVQVDVGGRYLVRVRGGHVSLEELRAWAARVKLKELAALS